MAESLSLVGEFKVGSNRARKLCEPGEGTSYTARATDHMMRARSTKISAQGMQCSMAPVMISLTADTYLEREPLTYRRKRLQVPKAVRNFREFIGRIPVR